MMSETQNQDHRRPNRLIHETSPYLLQHAYNPVDWYPWGAEAIRVATESQKPILLSIGYSACHWCHVMERESFEDERIAAFMNRHFVCIKVDREERPDLDDIYMQATIAMNQGQGGWPMTVFLTPEQQPIFAGTYFPPSDRWGRPGFLTVLQKITEVWGKDPDGLRDQASRVTARIQQEMTVPGAIAVGEEELRRAVAQFAREFDGRFGGFGSAPKFPPATGLLFLLRQHARSGDTEALRMVRTTLDAMAAGGIYDQIGGGFARYSTDERWLVPHFEKMLYDNALLARTYVEAYQAIGDPLYRRIAEETLDYVLREMQEAQGAFYSSTDADSEGVEGKFFVWTPEEIHAIAPSEEDARRFCAYFDVTLRGNWEKKNILHTPRPVEAVAQDLAISAEELRDTIERMKSLVYRARLQRVPPGLDDKILTGWNGMMISAMAEGGRILGNPSYRWAAEQAADFILGTLRRPDGGLFRTFRQGKAHLTAVLEDYAFLAEGLIDLYEAGAAPRYLHEARRLGERMLADFWDGEHGGFFTTARDHESLVVRAREGADGATPSGNAVAASVMARLAAHYGREDLRGPAVKAVRAYGRYLEAVPRAFPKSLLVLDFLLHGPVELAFVGNPSDTAYEALWREAQHHHLPDHVIAHGDPEQEAEACADHPLLRDKGLVEGKPALYICRNFACRRPITDPHQIAETLDRQREGARSSGSPAARLLTEARLPGSATQEGTAGYAARFPAASSRPYGYTTLGTTGLVVSRLGFGGYRIDTRTADHRTALLQALRSGCNLIDTSTNYGDGESERLVGTILQEFASGGELGRDQVIVVSKIGYVQGQNLKLAREREQSGHPFPEMVTYSDDLWHCLHPEFIADQLERSLDRLGLETLDVLLLHNPEYALMEAAKRNDAPLEQERRKFYDRLRAAFACLESQIEDGKLRWYGVSSNTVTLPPSDPEVVSFSRLLDEAVAAGGRDHHFAVLQCPMNLIETGAARQPNTGPDGSRTVLEEAQRTRVAVLVNRPLNAIVEGNRMIRLADIHVDPLDTSVEDQASTVRALEDEFRRELAPLLPKQQEGVAPSEYFRWGSIVPDLLSRVSGMNHWDQLETQMIGPHIHQVLEITAQHMPESAAAPWEAWQKNYVPEVLTLLKAGRVRAAETSRAWAERVTELIDPVFPEARRAESLSRKALWVLASTPGVTCVLNGMRTPGYVSDSLEVLKWPPLPPHDAHHVYDALQSFSA